MAETLTQAPAMNPVEAAKIHDWADVAEKNPQDLKERIKAASLLDLDELSRVIIETRRMTVNEEARKAVRERVEELNQSKDVEQHLEQLKQLVHLLRLLQIKAPPVAEEPSTVDALMAQPLRWLADKTKDVPVLKYLTGFGKNVKGRSIERIFYGSLSSISKNIPQTILWVLPLGSLLNGAGDYGNRKIAELDIQDAISRVRLVGETIHFTGSSAEEWEQWKKFAAEKETKKETVTVGSMTENYIRSIRDEQRLRGNAEGTINVSLAAIINPEGRKNVVTALEDTQKKKKFAEQWKPAEVAAITFGDGVAAKKEGGTWSITVPEKQLQTDGKPNTAETRLLQSSIAGIPAAAELTIVTAIERCEIDLEKKSVKIPVGMEPAWDSLNQAVMKGSMDRCAKIVFAKGEMRTDIMRARFNERDGGTLTLSNRPERIDALAKIGALNLSAAVDMNEFEFRNGSWAPLNQSVAMK
jgi:hypothetical protein